MKVQNMTSSRGNKIANQFVITDINNCGHKIEIFQSYDSVIAKIDHAHVDLSQNPPIGKQKRIYLDSTYWDYSVTTGKYRNQFLGETKKETERKIASGEYILTDLNS